MRATRPSACWYTVVTSIGPPSVPGFPTEDVSNGFQADRFAGRSEISTESLILAQDERWRRA